MYMGCPPRLSVERRKYNTRVERMNTVACIVRELLNRTQRLIIDEMNTRDLLP